ncbi:hypothetical protein SS50377_27151 [Spironucleus salmonicida]|uniref:EGF-like domain-containing protein n=1 Tax=Spironucleus salmonicida TaxID=348837 RepID=V6LH41_9EUKA|nr:hypothetical protein SS50377_27151 [Spironucleus salmonicida]|eukprot:EST43852.1 Hypothetical protein SS50377_16396 [Spironucleus salmonicida]
MLAILLQISACQMGRDEVVTVTAACTADKIILQNVTFITDMQIFLSLTNSNLKNISIQLKINDLFQSLIQQMTNTTMENVTIYVQGSSTQSQVMLVSSQVIECKFNGLFITSNINYNPTISSLGYTLFGSLFNTQMKEFLVRFSGFYKDNISIILNAVNTQIQDLAIYYQISCSQNFNILSSNIIASEVIISGESTCNTNLFGTFMNILVNSNSQISVNLAKINTGYSISQTIDKFVQTSNLPQSFLDAFSTDIFTSTDIPVPNKLCLLSDETIEVTLNTPICLNYKSQFLSTFYANFKTYNTQYQLCNCSGFMLPNCSISCRQFQCNSHGGCLAEKCTCDVAYSGKNCEQCSQGYQLNSDGLCSNGNLSSSNALNVAFGILVIILVILVIVLTIYLVKKPKIIQPDIQSLFQNEQIGIVPPLLQTSRQLQ